MAVTIVLVVIAPHAWRTWRSMGPGYRGSALSVLRVVVIHGGQVSVVRRRARRVIVCPQAFLSSNIVVTGHGPLVLLLLNGGRDGEHVDASVGVVLAVEEERVAGVQRSERVHVTLSFLCRLLV